MAFEKKPSKRFGAYRKENSKPAYKSRRGTLAPLMTEEAKSSANIQDLTYDFACRITRLYQYLTEDSGYKEYIISKQVFRSGTSIADFLAKMTIASKEANETFFWLRLLHDNGYLSDNAFNSIISDCLRVRNKIRAITKTTMDNITAHPKT